MGSLDVGVVLKRHLSEIISPIVSQILILLGTAIGIAIVGVAIEGFAAQRMLHSIEETWEKSKAIVEKEKAGFELLVSALYPKFVTERLLEGDSQIVLNLPEAMCFFSDICNFTAISNQLLSSEMLDWIGYIFRAMDCIAEYHRIYKVKTIGDVYFAISGMPNMTAEGETDDHTFRMLCFAIYTSQIFSGRYQHPEAGAALAAVAEHSVLQLKNRRYANVIKPARSLERSSGSGQSAFMRRSSETSNSDPPLNSSSMVAMRFGICTGPVTCGVLQGKCPVFDVWGKTVNKMSRFEASSRPGNVHVSELMYHTVTTNPKCLIVWEKGHGVYAKGFGNVQGYFPKKTDMLPPKDLLLRLGVEPALGTFSY